MRQGWSPIRGLVPRAGEPGRLPRRGGMDTQTSSGARTWALRLSCGVLVEAAEKALCDRISSLVRMVRSPWGRVPKTEEIEQVFLLSRVMYKAILGLHFQRQQQKKNGQLAIF